MDQIDGCLKYEPERETRNNKILRPNRLAERVLRIDRFRVFYDIDEAKAVVKIEAIGHKRGNRLYVRGEEFQL
jgi:mRNA-degrading endonuclease RelE of RelBE toxin-antitoxin system